MPIPFTAPEQASIPQGVAGDIIHRGRLILTHTLQQLSQYATSHLRCSNCHLKAGTVAYAAHWVGVTTRYPRYSNRCVAEVSLRQRIQGYFKRSLNGVAPPVDSEPMDAIVAYMTWLLQGIDDGYPYAFPPLWGNNSFNIAAEMARLRKRRHL